ncbi:metal ABC transporter ATP-binding protein [Candidatus Cyanaurora vandensis]|uniref:metal ABC transporter ATP-binding protein n=1 Tax=Candidatus Cyanaurora vandensis TaxID=2714958 RepID=UPI00257D714A|nr:metal ABC transporter ATP-binding protein [Candidatus Cyanaurora vandensis]
MFVLSLKNVTVDRAGGPVLKDVSFTVQPGTLCALVGPNGAGKTTLLKAVLGLVAYRGQIRAVGDLGYIPQALRPTEPFPLTVLELVAAGCPRRSWWWPAAFQGASLAALDQVGMAHLAQRPVGKLSGGEFQRVLLAHALIAERRILLLDEPTTGLDSTGIDDLFELLARLRGDGVTMLMVCHELSWVTRWADWVVCLNQRVIAQGKPLVALSAHNLALAYPGRPPGGYGELN